MLGADSHTSSHGGLGAFAIGLGGADITAAMVLGQSWIEVPEAIAVEYAGALPFGIGGKDVILQTLGELGRNTVAMERTRRVPRRRRARSFSTDMRFTIANMTAEFGGLNGIFEADERGRRLARRAAHRRRTTARATSAPTTTRPTSTRHTHRPGRARAAGRQALLARQRRARRASALGMKLDGCFIGACTTTEEELVLGALVLEQALKDRAARPPVARKQLVVPGDLSIQARLREARPVGASTSGPASGSARRAARCAWASPARRRGTGEVWLSLAEPQLREPHGRRARSPGSPPPPPWRPRRVEMKIADPRPLLAPRRPRPLRRSSSGATRTRPRARGARRRARRSTSPQPRRRRRRRNGRGDQREPLRGRVQRFGDHVDTDAIIPGEFCHLTDARGARRSKAFHYVRPEFSARAQAGQTIVVAGEGWGSGSSREQAVWALQGAGIKAVIAQSYAFIHKRNLVNEALPYLVVTDPRFYELAAEDAELSVDLAAGTVTHVASGLTFKAERPSPIVQALQREGGLVPAIRHHGSQVFDALGGAA